jgi:hypothetical protein
MPDASNNRFPMIHEFKQAEFSRLGYTARWVSIFNHWLSEEEAATSKVMCYDLSVRAGASAEYLAGEQKLLSFYTKLFRDGAVQHLVPWCEDEPIQIIHHARFDARLLKVVVTSLRHGKGGDLMDCYVPHRSLRVLGGNDRTDLLLFEDASVISEIEQLAHGCGLSVLA